MSDDGDDAATILGQPLRLPCGVELKNRIIKSAMSDSLGDGAGNPTEAQVRLYERWAQGGAALSIIGEVQGNPHFAEKPGNLVLQGDSDMTALRALARSGSTNGAQIWPQLGHAGALAHPPISDPKGPSPLSVDGLQCAGLSLEEIAALPSTFARTAKLAKNAGFGGVQLHAGHGFLFSQFLSPLFNHRDDGYGGSTENRFRIIGETIEAMRLATGPAFAIAIKINATDKLEGGLSQDDSLNIVRLLDSTSIDLIDVSGGTYFPGAPASSDGTSKSGPYFIEFSRRAKTITSKPLMLTGGFRTRDQAVDALKSGAADAVGLARALALNPNLANNWLNDSSDPTFPVFGAPPPGSMTAWYSMRLTALGEDKEDQFNLSPHQAIERYNARDEARTLKWIERFSPVP